MHLIINIVVFHGSPRKGNTYHATKIFMDELVKHSDINFTEFFMPADFPKFCIGCALCLGGKHEKCPNAAFVAPILQAILQADALIFATPHYGGCLMPATMKNLLDHLDFLVLNINPHEHIFDKKAFVITTGAGSITAAGAIKKAVRHWGINRVYACGLRLFAVKWENMPAKRQTRLEKTLRCFAKKFLYTKKRRPYFSTILYYYMTKFVIKKYVGSGNFPYENWESKGYFKHRPF